jgi:hypothetical protein
MNIRVIAGVGFSRNPENPEVADTRGKPNNESKI